MEKGKNQGIELLRIVLTLFICVLHIMLQGGVLLNSDTIHSKLFILIEICCYCAVDGYALISGYVSQSRKNNYSRLVQILLTAVFYSFVVTFVLRKLNFGEPLHADYFVSAIFPFLYGNFWYITAYFPLFFFMPFINKTVDNLDIKESKYLLLMFVILFSVTGTFFDIYYLHSGYSFLWLIILYTIGSLIKKIKLFDNMKSTMLGLLFCISVIITWLIYFYLDDSRLISYLSPTILFCAITLVIIFSRFDIKISIIPRISSLCLGIYLFQNNTIIWNYFIKDAFIFISNINILFAPLAILICSFCIFVIGAAVDSVRIFIFKLFRVDKISDYIGTFVEKVVDFIISLI